MEILFGVIADYIQKHVGRRSISYVLLAIILVLGIAAASLEWTVATGMTDR